MQFAIRVTILECFFVKHSHGPLGVKVRAPRQVVAYNNLIL
jgi:hypothetical protein